MHCLRHLFSLSFLWLLSQLVYINSQYLKHIETWLRPNNQLAGFIFLHEPCYWHCCPRRLPKLLGNTPNYQLDGITLPRLSLTFALLLQSNPHWRVLWRNGYLFFRLIGCNAYFSLQYHYSPEAHHQTLLRIWICQVTWWMYHTLNWQTETL